ncbi:MAG TPA: mechanosensitive ion channel domain-containing protein [Candidatus Limnocylindrales bacterium]|nr:mechanosensitive ion channel domain-containing protein [Candidatus Limnocylindrales bacterium]
MTIHALLVCAATFAACIAASFAIQRAGRRLQRRLAAASGGGGLRRRLGDAAVVSALLLQAGVWSAAAWLLSERVMAAHQWRAMIADVLQMSLTAPLFTLDARSYSALDLLLLPAMLAALWLSVSALTRVLRTRVLAAAGIEAGFQETVSVLLRYVLTFLGAIVILNEQGVDLRSFAILASVLGVGIGFGLQNIANNFVSGLLINMERPIRPGDYVAVGALEGTVVRVGARSTEIRTNDSVAILVPNSRFLESEVINWSHGDPTSRLHLPVTVPYGTDLSRARRALMEVARGVPSVLREPRPSVQMRRFGSDGIELDLLVWTREPRTQQALVSELGLRIERAFAGYAIAIASSQRDLDVAARTLERAAAIFAGAQPHTEQADAAVPMPEPPPEAGIEEWDDAEIASLAARMAGDAGVAVEDRRHLLSVYPQSFVGTEAVTWMTEHAGLTRSEAVTAGRRMVAAGLVRHVLDEHDFRDGYFFYRFTSGAARAAA